MWPTSVGWQAKLPTPKANDLALPELRQDGVAEAASDESCVLAECLPRCTCRPRAEATAHGGTQARAPSACAHATGGLANAVSYAQDEPKCLRQACALLRSSGENAACEFLLRAEVWQCGRSEDVLWPVRPTAQTLSCKPHTHASGQAARRLPRCTRSWRWASASGVTPSGSRRTSRLGRRARHSAACRLLRRVRRRCSSQSQMLLARVRRGGAASVTLAYPESWAR